MRHTLAVAFVILGSALASPSWSQTSVPWGDTGIAQTSLTNGDVRYIQDALVWNEVYVGLKDGGWGPMTQSAVDAWRKRYRSDRTGGLTPREIASLMGFAWKAKDEVGWKVWIDPKTGATIGYPSKYVSPEQLPAVGVEALRTKYIGNRGVYLISSRKQESNIVPFVEGLTSGFDVKSIDYRLSRPFRQVISFTTKDEMKLYIRYDITQVGWSGFLLGMRSDVPKYSLIATAISTDFSPDGTKVLPDPDAAPTIVAVLKWVGNDMPNTLDGEPVQRRPQTPSQPPVAERPNDKEIPRKIVGAGTAFSISPNGVSVTNSHVIDKCNLVTDSDGKNLKVVSIDSKRDLALIDTESSTRPFLKLRRDQTIDLGENLFLAGFPYYGSISTSLNLTNGIVTSLKGIADTPMHFQLNASLQPGNSGGPVLDASGAVIGVAVARVNDIKALQSTGTVPQSMNYAIRGSVLEAFLLENDILLTKKSDSTAINSKDIAKLATDSVFPILCWR